MLAINFFFICCLIVCVKSSGNHSEPAQYCIYSQKPPPNYYWRKYEGVIPHDVIPGGHTPSGSITYIAQVLVTSGKHHALLPATIQIGQTEVEAAFYGVKKVKNYIAILCSNTPSALKWTLVNEHELNLINEYLIVGGHENVETAYIGRVSYSNHLIVGKVFTKGPKGLRIVTSDTKEELFNTFEVLVFDPTD